MAVIEPVRIIDKDYGLSRRCWLFYNQGIYTDVSAAPSDIANSDTIQTSGAASGSIFCPSSIALTAYGSIDGTNFYPLYNSSVSAVTITTGGTNRVIELPAACLSVPFLRFLSASGTIPLKVCLKG